MIPAAKLFSACSMSIIKISVSIPPMWAWSQAHSLSSERSDGMRMLDFVSVVFA